MIPELVEIIEKSVGKTIEEINRTPIDELRRNAEKKLGTGLNFRVRWPLIGRGNILRNRVLSHEAIECRLDKELK